MKLRRVMFRIYWLISAQFGIDLRKTLRSLLGLPRYVRDFFRFRSSYTGRLELLPCLNDWDEEGGTTKDEYFRQDLLVARKIFEAKPERHVDIGSRVDGFVAHVASFRQIEVFDVRPITTQIQGITFKQVDFMKPLEGMEGYCDSLSCLHALEHFGLGRYGDPIDQKGFESGFVNMASLLKKDGVFYLSVPIGIERVEFNANRVFEPSSIVNLAIQNSLRLSVFILIHQGGKVDVLALDDMQFLELVRQRYVLGIFIFYKV
jgi:hypothetical protein